MPWGLPTNHLLGFLRNEAYSVDAVISLLAGCGSFLGSPADPNCPLKDPISSTEQMPIDRPP